MVRINRVIFIGTQTEPSRMRQVLGIKTNAIYSEAKIRRRWNKKFADDFILSGFQIARSDTAYVLQIDAREKKSQQIIGALSYLPAHKELNGYFYLNINNLFQTLRKVNLGWERNAGFTGFNLNYTDPYLLGFLISGNINHLVYDTNYAKTDFSLSANISLTDILSLYFITSYDRTIPGMLNLTDFQTIWYGQGIIIENRTIADNPFQGYAVDFSSKLGSRKKSPHNQLLNKTVLTAQIGFPVFLGTAFTSGLSIHNLYSNTGISISDSLYIGGTKTLRGFRENEFATDRCLLSRNEFSLLSGKATNIYLFGDLAVIRLNEYAAKIGYGVGIKSMTRIGIVGIEYGVSAQNNLLNGKIHIQFSNRF